MARIYEDMIAAEQKIINGDIYTPVEIRGTGRRRMMMTKLEEVRLAIVSERDKAQEQNIKNKTAVASVTHDLKTPLAVISGYAECLQDGISDKDYTSLILKKVEDMNEMVLGLVESSRQEMIENLRLERIDARQYFGNIFNKLSPLAAQKGVRFKARKAPKANLRIDAKDMARVFQNIISNAVKYTPAEGSITVSFSRSNSYLTVKVADTGSGIEKKNLPYVFDKFYMEDASRPASASGSGLGLYIAKEIVERHGGKISAKSKKGKGTTFIVKLPIEQDFKPYEGSRAFDEMSRTEKTFIVLFFGWIMPFVYRVIRYGERGRRSTMYGALLSIPFFAVFWFADLISVLATGKIVLLAD